MKLVIFPDSFSERNIDLASMQLVPFYIYLKEIFSTVVLNSFHLQRHDILKPVQSIHFPTTTRNG